MIKGILASNTSKLIASCVCPVAGTIALTVGVPPIRNAVHKATAPRAYALPKTRTRAPVAGGPSSRPVQTALAIPPCEPVLTAGTIAPFEPALLANNLPDIRDFTSQPVIFAEDGPVGGLIVQNDQPLLPAVPEPGTWLHMLVGFGVIGFGARMALRRQAAAEPEIPAA